MVKRLGRAGRTKRAGLALGRCAGACLIAVIMLILDAAVWLPAGLAEPAPDRRCAPPAYGLWRIWNWGEEATWELTPARPRAIEISNTRRRPGPGVLTISVSISKCSPGATPEVVVKRSDAAGQSTDVALPLISVGHVSRGTLLVSDFGGPAAVKALVTARLSGGPDASACYTISVSFRPTASSSEGALGEPRAPEGPPAAPPDPPAPTSGMLAPLTGLPRLPPPQITVKRVTRQTSSRREDRTFHSLWLWSFGDGVAYADSDPENVISTQVHPFVTPGVYSVTAQSVSNKGSVLREQNWTVIVPPPPPGVPPVPVIRAFCAETVQEPEVRLELAGPRKWVVGRPADYAVTVDFADPPRAGRESVLVDPGREFAVVWDRPGRFVVRAAAVVHLRYEFPERVISIVNTYVVERQVEVFATVSTD